ncbi:MAG: hypothetical protein IT446_01950 [Phycisphaerales bacterium]|jgi:hypothetical protein|nr:hypothetical protein [Phycisphaerales bacterium]
MDRPYLVLWFALSLFAVLLGWGLYHQLHNPPAPASTQPTTRPLVDRLREERLRRQQEHNPSPTTATAPSM